MSTFLRALTDVSPVPARSSMPKAGAPQAAFLKLATMFMAASLWTVPAAPTWADDPKPTDTAPQAVSPWPARMQALEEFYRSQSGKELDEAARLALLEQLLADVDPATLSVSEIEEGWRVLELSPEKGPGAVARLTELAKAGDAQGARAAVLIVRASRRVDPEAWPDRVGAAIDHPGLEAYVAEVGRRPQLQLVGALAELEPAQRGSHVERALAWVDGFTPSSPPADLRLMGGYATTLRGLVDKERFDAALDKFIGVANAAAESAQQDGREADAEMLGKLARRLDTAAMRGELIGHSAPALTFNWIEDRTGTPSWRSLDELKGKVVVLDYWATWCGPCVASFPHVRELRAHYPPEQVAIVGVTSLQGAHYWRPHPDHPDRERKVDTKGNPELEKSLMREYMDEMDITWTVAFTDQEVFNPEYDVNGIPHLTIIDAEGKVRHNGLHPAMPLTAKTEKIDELLREAGFTPPPAPAEKADADAKQGG